MHHASGASAKPGASFAQLALRSQEFAAAGQARPFGRASNIGGQSIRELRSACDVKLSVGAAEMR